MKLIVRRQQLLTSCSCHLNLYELFLKENLNVNYTRVVAHILNEMRVIFCDNLIDRKVDPDFEEEYKSAIGQGFQVGLISFEHLNDLNIQKSISRIKEQEELELAIYRGWMIQPDKYELLYAALLKKKVRLINTPEEYSVLTPYKLDRIIV